MFGQHDDQSKHNADQADSDTGVNPTHSDTIQPVDGADQAWQHPAVVTTDDAADSTTDASISEPDDEPAATTASTHSVATDDLVEIKRQALGQLSPLVGHLDQSPEEKFRTTMMMIQASDDQSLVPTAYKAAQAIEDEKARAQALLDIINEINYFTQHDNN